MEALICNILKPDGCLLEKRPKETQNRKNQQSCQRWMDPYFGDYLYILSKSWLDQIYHTINHLKQTLCSEHSFYYL